MHALEPMPGWRIIADSPALDALTAAAPQRRGGRATTSDLGAPNDHEFARLWREDAQVVARLAPDDLLVIGLTAPEPGDEQAIVVPDHGWSGTWFNHYDFDRIVRPLLDWQPPARGLGQGLVAGVPAKVVSDDHTVLLLCPTAYAHELNERLGA